MKITVFDTYTGSLNTGDAIIMDACVSALRDIFPSANENYFPTHLPISAHDFSRAMDHDFSFFCGTNAFRRNWRFRARKNQWSINAWQIATSKPVYLMGAGWNSYKTGSNYLSRLAYRRLLRTDGIHSVRDEFTAQTLREIGVKNVLNTGCPTLWKVTEDHQMSIPQHKGEAVVFTLTDYDRDLKSDAEMIMLLGREYKRVIFWPQGALDLEYFKSIDIPFDVEIIPAGLSSYDDILLSDVDFIGTRLHAGIRALQKKRRTIIISIDNRAMEMHRDFNIPIVKRGDIETLKRTIRIEWRPDIKLPEENIMVWKSQFYKSIDWIAP